MSQDSPLVKYLYDIYKTGRDYPSAPPVINLADFATKHNHYFWQDSMGDWQIFLNQDYSAMAECGKPVIYLYPQNQTEVSVKVAANITKSEPLYPQNGWTVIAKPNGQLTYQGQTYPNLFWEGQGWGIYPNYQNSGTLVSQKDLIPTLKSQLTELGLNTQESADFMEFWQPKLPTSSYVRLTWLTTEDMDMLAPLLVTPKPDTRIRIFLEFAGYDEPVKLIPQNLSSPPRLGFTLVEWGGLLIRN